MSNGGSYDPCAVESEIYRVWEEDGHFHAQPNPDKRPFVIDIPLPNVTGALHLGHALNNTLQDILVRHKRMCGYETLWMPGTDHAGIATQAVVERRLREEQNLTRRELGREGLVKKIWEWKEEYGGRILRQLRQIGSSCDWQRTRFTLDEVCAKAVYEVFFEWFKAGLIYRGLRLVNWDAHLQTAVADDEIVHETVQGNLWHYRYPILPTDAVAANDPDAGRNLSEETIKAAIAAATAEGAKLGRDYVSIATTRPETMLGDTAIAVHPDDDRYRHLIGHQVLLPLQNRAIPVIADGLLVKKEFGTGCVKVTPGHDPNDHACGQRNDLEVIDILTLDGRINDNGGAYAGLDRYEARDKVVADLEKLGLMENIEPYEHEVGHSDRSKTPIEPLRSEQWFVKMGDLAETAMEAVRDGRVQFFPKRYERTYLDWLGEKRDWCISRQLWWGHQIPVWQVIVPADRYLEQEKSRPRSLARVQTEFFDALDEFATAFGIPGDLVAMQSETGKPKFHICARTSLACKELRSFYQRHHRASNTGEFTRDGQVASHLSKNDPRKNADEALRNSIRTMNEQDPDVLDTWFSSALWPFSTLHWPDTEGNADLEYFYPTSVLVTAREIITLWVARMVMTGLYFQKRVPFQHVHIHPNIQDGQGRRMSKSAGNGVDPVDIIERYGADALRFTMAQMDTETQDARLPVSYLCPHCGHMTPHSSVVPHGKVPASVHKVKCKDCKKPFATVWADGELKDELGVGIDTSDRFEMGRNFCNKIWQVATGFVMPNIAGHTPRPLKPDELALEDRWILSRLSATVADVDRRLARYQISEITSILYSFFWNDFCDWYVELVKPRLFARDADGEVVTRSDNSAAVARQVLTFVLDQTLRIMHPLLPFVTEALWGRLAESAPQRGLSAICEAEPLLIGAAWPDVAKLERDPQSERELEALQNVIRALRDTLARVNTNRAAAKTPAVGKLPRAVIRTDKELAAGLQKQSAVLQRLGRCEALEIGADLAKPPESAAQVLTGVEVYVPLAGLMDLEAERARLQKERDDLLGHIERLGGKLSNEGFVSKAPAAVVERERQRLAEMKERCATLDHNLADITG